MHWNNVGRFNPGAVLLVFEAILSSIVCRLELQPDDVDRGGYDFMDHNDPTLCTRTCRLAEPPRICYFKFHLEFYTTLGRACGHCPQVKEDCFNPQCVTADGYPRAILTVNRRLPAPSIQVCKGDTIVADVINQMPSTSSTIHWHGIRQRRTPWMDGVPMVTQCPINEGQTFRYRFVVDEAGTYFYHSHDGLQKVDGIEGGLIVREPDAENSVRGWYDLDLPSHSVFLQDWLHTPANDRLPGLRKKDVGQMPESYLINGLGAQLKNVFELYGAIDTPLAEFHVTSGLRYRFRIIGGTCLSCPARISFQDHQATVIAIDDNPVEPVAVDSIVLASGERYDIVLTADRPAAAYWITVRGLGECLRAVQTAVLRYRGSQTSRPPLPHWSALLSVNNGYDLNPRNPTCTEETLSSGICVSQLRSRMPNPPRVAGPPDMRLFLPFGFHYYKNEELYQPGTYHRFFIPFVGLQVAGVINNVSNVMPSAPLLTQLDDVPPAKFCRRGYCDDDAASRTNDRLFKDDFPICECINLIKIPLGAVVELVLVDTTPPNPLALTHPFHIHGHDFFVVEQGKLASPLEHLFHELQLKLATAGRLSSFLPVKDTVVVPAFGYTVVRILADNPGFWLYHCHFAYHLVTGMSAIFQVGEPADYPPPPADFPRCKQFVPPVDDFS